MWGYRQHHIIDAQKKNGRHFLVMERGYIGDRFKWTSLGFDGLNGRATFPAIQDGGKRWDKHFQQFLKPWRGAHSNLAVIMGQVPGDAALQGVDFVHWVIKTAGQLKAKDFSVAFRPHPNPRSRLRSVANIKTLDGTLEQALNQAALVVTYNSNSGVDAVLAGTPVYAADRGSMVYELSNGLNRVQPDRTLWTRKMAYTQWLSEEIESGEAWAALRTVIDGHSSTTTHPRLDSSERGTAV
jgi:hypothetical protein